MQTQSYSLTDNEVLLLDGKVSEKVQKEIDTIKESRKLHSHPIVGKALEESLRLGTFSWNIEYTRHCGLCGKSCEYAKHKRSSRNAWGHKLDLSEDELLFLCKKVISFAKQNFMVDDRNFREWEKLQIQED